MSAIDTPAMLDYVMPLTFAVTGLSRDRLVYSVLGSGFFVAPYTGLTAAHVVRGLWDKLEMPWKQGSYPRSSVEAEFELAAVQQVDEKNSYLAAHWKITGATPLAQTDIAFLNLVPNSEVAERFLWPRPFPELELLSPDLGSKVCGFGYPGATYKHTPGEAIVDITAEPTLIEGEVVGIYPEGRGSWGFPQFEVTCPFEPGMSGGPVIHGERVCGVISYGPNLENGECGPSFGATLWPILAAHSESSIDPRQPSNPVLEMLANGAITAPGWRQLHSRITVTIAEDGEPRVKLEA